MYELRGAGEYGGLDSIFTQIYNHCLRDCGLEEAPEGGFAASLGRVCSCLQRTKHPSPPSELKYSSSQLILFVTSGIEQAGFHHNPQSPMTPSKQNEKSDEIQFAVPRH